MPAQEDDSDAEAPRGRSQWIVGGAALAVVVLVLTQGLVALLLLTFVAAVVGVLVGLAYAAFTAVRGKVPESGDHPMPTLSPNTDDEAQRAEAGHVSPSASS